MCCFVSFFVCLSFFFFSSRRRHTRCLSDWSSDVCSSDLASRSRERLREQLREHRLDERTVEIELSQAPMPSFEVVAGASMEEIGSNLKDMRSEERRVGKEGRWWWAQDQ